MQNIAVVYNRVLTPSISNQILAGVNYFNQVFNDYRSPTTDVQSLGFVTGAILPQRSQHQHHQL